MACTADLVPPSPTPRVADMKTPFGNYGACKKQWQARKWGYMPEWIERNTLNLCFKIKGEVQATHAARIAYYLEYLIFTMKEKHVEPSLTWLVNNNLIGMRFLHFIDNDCKGSALELMRALLMRIEREKAL